MNLFISKSFGFRALLALWLLLLVLAGPGPAGADWRADIKKVAGAGAVALADGQGKMVLALRADEPLVPASILKIITAGAALKTLKPDYRFQTDFGLTPAGDLVISGRGDPMLISEEISLIAARLKGLGLKKIGRILVDDSFFNPVIDIPGRGLSRNPYDAFNGALSVNFNSIALKISSKGRIRSAESQTPLTPLAKKEARASGKKGQVRISLAKSRQKCLIYAGELFLAIFRREGIKAAGPVALYQSDRDQAKIFYRHQSSLSLAEVIAGMLKYSNNFTANQIFLVAGAELYGHPANLAKGQKAVRAYLDGLGLKAAKVVEGSGLARENRLTARQMLRVLADFKPHRHLLSYKGRLAQKTGTLKGVRSLAGFIDPQKEHPAAFVIILNGQSARQGKREKLAELLLRGVSG